MFEDLKEKLQEQLGNVKIEENNQKDPVYKKLLDEGYACYDAKDYKTSVAYFELGMDQLGWDNKDDTYPFRIGLLMAYTSGNFFTDKNAVQIAKMCGEELIESNAYIPMDSMRIGMILLSCEDDSTKSLGFDFIEKAYLSSRNQAVNLGLNNQTALGVSLTVREYVKALFYLKKYKKIFPIIDEATEVTNSRNVFQLDAIVGIYYFILVAYCLNDEYTNSEINHAIENFEQAQGEVPEACFILALLESDQIIDKTNANYFQNAKALIKEYEGDVLYPPYVFKAFFDVNTIDKATEKYNKPSEMISKSKLYVRREKTLNSKKEVSVSNTTNASTSSGTSSGGCYVATAVYGSYDCPEVWTLRRYRDNQLAKTWYGRLFIHTYYAISPTLVKWFGETQWFKNMWKPKLDRMVKELQENGVENTPYNDIDW